MRKNPRLAIRMVVPVLCILSSLLVGVCLGLCTSKCEAYATPWRGACFRKHFLVCMLERDHKRNPPMVVIGSGWTAEKLGNKHGDLVCIE